MNSQKAIFNLRIIKEWQELKSFPLYGLVAIADITN
jgi:hypothetical protein